MGGFGMGFEKHGLLPGRRARQHGHWRPANMNDMACTQNVACSYDLPPVLATHFFHGEMAYHQTVLEGIGVPSVMIIR